MALPDDLILNSDGQEQLRQAICTAGRLDPGAREHDSVQKALHVLFERWKPVKANDEQANLNWDLAKCTWPRYSTNSFERIQCAQALDFLTEGRFTRTNSHQGGPGRSFSFAKGTTGSTTRALTIRGDIIEAAIHKLVELGDNAEKERKQKRAKASKRYQEQKAAKSREAIPAIAGRLANTPTAELPTSKELKEMIAEALGPMDHLSLINYLDKQTPFELLSIHLAKSDIALERELKDSIQGKKPDYRTHEEWMAFQKERYTANTRQFVEDCIAFIREFKNTPRLSGKDAVRHLSSALGLEGDSSANNIGAIIYQFMRKHELDPADIIPLYHTAEAATPLERHDQIMESKLKMLMQYPDTTVFDLPLRQTTIDSLAQALSGAALAKTPSTEATAEEIIPVVAPVITERNTSTVAQHEEQIGSTHVSIRWVRIAQYPDKEGVVVTLKSGENQSRYFFTAPKKQIESISAKFISQASAKGQDIDYHQFNAEVGKILKEMGLVVPDKRGHYVDF